MGLFSRREPWYLNCRYCNGKLLHKPNSEYAYCPKCDCEMLKSQVKEYWDYQIEKSREEEKQRRYENRYSYYPEYAELLEQANQNGDTRCVFLDKNDESLNPYQYSLKVLGSLAGGSYNYMCNSFVYPKYKSTAYTVIGLFTFDLDEERSSKYHLHYKCKGKFTIYAAVMGGSEDYIKALDNHVKNELTNLSKRSKKELDENIQERLALWKRCYYGFDDFDFDNITYELSLEVTYKYHSAGRIMV